MDENEHRLSKFFKLLGNGLRLQMAKRLLERKYYVRELAEELDRSEKTISRHFRVFRNQDIVESETEERRRYYWLKQPELVQQALNLTTYFTREE
ncbi:MAG: ArsR/SmtB family transcription factor [bacterium]